MRASIHVAVSVYPPAVHQALAWIGCTFGMRSAACTCGSCSAVACALRTPAIVWTDVACSGRCHHGAAAARACPLVTAPCLRLVKHGKVPEEIMHASACTTFAIASLARKRPRRRAGAAFCAERMWWSHMVVPMRRPALLARIPCSGGAAPLPCAECSIVCRRCRTHACGSMQCSWYVRPDVEEAGSAWLIAAPVNVEQQGCPRESGASCLNAARRWWSAIYSTSCPTLCCAIMAQPHFAMGGRRPWFHPLSAPSSIHSTLLQLPPSSLVQLLVQLLVLAAAGHKVSRCYVRVGRCAPLPAAADAVSTEPAGDWHARTQQVRGACCGKRQEPGRWGSTLCGLKRAMRVWGAAAMYAAPLFCPHLCRWSAEGRCWSLGCNSSMAATMTTAIAVAGQPTCGGAPPCIG